MAHYHSPVSPQPHYFTKNPAEIDKKITSQPMDNPNRSYARFPPEVVRNFPLGYLTDWSAAKFSRDIGRSSVFGGLVYYQFGDTFCKDKDGEFVGLVTNTISVVTTTQGPLLSKYEDVAPNGKVEQFIPFSLQDVKFNNEHESEKKRITIWSFGGIVEVSPGVGVLWYERGEASQHGNELTYRGTGVARVCIEEKAKNGFRPVCHLLHDKVFGPDEVHWGAFSAVLNNDRFIYLYGNREGNIYIGRVRARHPGEKGAYARSAYEFFDGQNFGKDLNCAVSIMPGFTQGNIFRSNLFHPSYNANYLFIGCNNYGDSKIIMGWASKPEGPWQFRHIADAVGIGGPEGYKYAMYAHPWAFNEANGELMVTWSEHWPGGVVATKLKFRMEPEIPTSFGHRIVMKFSSVYMVNDLPVDIRLHVSSLQDTIIKLLGPSLTIEQRGIVYPPEANPMQWQPQKLHLVIESASERAVQDAIELLDHSISKHQKKREERISTQTANLKSVRFRARMASLSKSFGAIFSNAGKQDEAEPTVPPNEIGVVLYVAGEGLKSGVVPAKINT